MIQKMRMVPFALFVAMVSLMAACGKKEAQYDVDLVKNGSFEQVASDGIPVGWTLEPFRGGTDEAEVQYGIDNNVRHDGANSWFFRGDPGTRRWYMLSQEVEVAEGSEQIEIQGWIQTDGTRMAAEQHMQCNFLLTFYDRKHDRFQGVRIADQRTPFRHGTNPWMKEQQTYRLPAGTRYVKVSCVLGANGQAWFDSVALSIPRPIPWEVSRTKNFVFHSLPGHPMPAGSQQAQQQIFDYVGSRLNLKSDVIINYYFYPDTATIRQMLNIHGYEQVNWDDAEFHSINPNDNHEIVHLMTDRYGRPPQVIAEGTVFWLHDEWGGKSIDDGMRAITAGGKIPMLASLFDPILFARARSALTMPMAASFVGFLVERWGPDKLLELYTALNGVNAYAAAEPAFQRTYGVSLQEIEDAWHTELSARLQKTAAP